MSTALVHRHKHLSGCADHQLETAAPLLQRAEAVLKVWRWRHRVRSKLRRDLLVMDVVRTEKDTGMVTGTLRLEAAKPFWKA